MITIDVLAREIIEYFEIHTFDAQGINLYMQAKKILGDIQVYPIDEN